VLSGSFYDILKDRTEIVFYVGGDMKKYATHAPGNITNNHSKLLKQCYVALEKSAPQTRINNMAKLKTIIIENKITELKFTLITRGKKKQLFVEVEMIDEIDGDFNIDSFTLPDEDFSALKKLLCEHGGDQ